MFVSSRFALGRLLADLELLERNGEPDEQVRCLLQIARKGASQGFLVAAARACRIAARLAERPAPDEALRGQALGLLGEVLAAAGHALFAIACFERAAAALVQGGRPREARAARLCAAILHGEREPEIARGQLLSLLEELTVEAEPALFAEVLLALGELDLDAQEFRAALVCAETAERAAALAQAAGPAQGELRVRGAALRGAALAGLEQAGEAMPLLTAAIHALRGGTRPATLGRTLEWKGWLLLLRGERAQAHDCWKEALQVRQKARQAGPSTLLALRLAASLQDNPAEALRYLIVALDTLRPMRRPPAELVSWAARLAESQPETQLHKQLQRLLLQLPAAPSRG